MVTNLEQIRMEEAHQQNDNTYNKPWMKKKVCKISRLVVVIFVVVCLVAVAAIGYIYPKQELSIENLKQNGPAVEALKQAMNIDPTKNQMNVAIRNDFLLQDCFTGNLKQSFPDLDYALCGYHYMKGFPWSYGHDPGLLNPIFKADYSGRLQSADCKFSIPAGYVIVPDVSCDLSFSSTEIKNKEQLVKAVGNSANANGNLQFQKKQTTFDFGFTASYGYSDFFQKIELSGKVMIVSTATCQSYYARLKMQDPPPFSKSFVSWLEKLDKASTYNVGNLEEEDLEVYLEFIDNYGTHFLREVKFGARFTKEYTMSYSHYNQIKKVEKSFSIGIMANIVSKVTLGLAVGFERTESETKMVEDFTKNVESRTITIGSSPPASGDAGDWAAIVKQTPVPFSYEIEPIERIFDPIFMKPYSNINTKRIMATLEYVLTNKSDIIRARAAPWQTTCRVFLSRFELPEDICIRGQSRDLGDIEYDRCYQECLEEPGCEAVNIYSRTVDGNKHRSCIFYTSKDTEHNFKLVLEPADKSRYDQHCLASIFPRKLLVDTKANTNLQKAGKLFLKQLKVDNSARLHYVGCAPYYKNSERCVDSCITTKGCVFSAQVKGNGNDYCCFQGTEAHVSILEISIGDAYEYIAFIKTDCLSLN